MDSEGATVRLPGMMTKRLLAIGLACACLVLGTWSWSHWRRANSVVPSHSYQLQAGRMDEWTAVGGTWEIDDGVIRNNSSERGAKLLTGSKDWRNYTLNADIRFDGGGADMGVILRANDEIEGVDTYNGYFVGLRNLDGTIVIGRSNYGWMEARPLSIPGGVHPSVWYRLRVTAYECNIAASVQNLTTFQTAWIAFEERSCVETGRIGLRSLNPGGTWRNISVTRAGWNDYLELQKHAAFVERPEVPVGPPWWTPWHVGMLFAGALALALLAQLIYFRTQRWKTYTIMQERERLAHEIHDTMAQSFAGVGYQIQGLRSSLVRGDRRDTTYIVDQLSVAYQLIRRCHTEASETIAMLGSPSPRIQQNLLEKLAKTAHKIAGSGIKTVTEIHGSPVPLNLRTADALLHIGEEAIANAVSHADPTILTLILSYEEGSVELMVEDNGKGFEYGTKTAGFGILGMQKRARDVAGTLEIASVPEGGTTVRVQASLQWKKLHERILTKTNIGFRSIVTNRDSR
jgi:signal transduction histidine kinase